MRLTAIVVLLDGGLHGALLRIINALRLHILALGTHAARGIHALLESIALPAEDVVYTPS